MQFCPIWQGRKERRNKGMNQCWLNGRVLNCISSPRKLGKADMESLNKICPSEKSHASQEWACLIVFAMPSHQLGAVQGGSMALAPEQWYVSKHGNWDSQRFEQYVLLPPHSSTAVVMEILLEVKLERCGNPAKNQFHSLKSLPLQCED